MVSKAHQVFFERGDVLSQGKVVWGWNGTNTGVLKGKKKGVLCSQVFCSASGFDLITAGCGRSVMMMER